MIRIIKYFTSMFILLIFVFIVSFVRAEIVKKEIELEKTSTAPEPFYLEDGTSFDTHLPLIIIDNGGGYIEKDDYVFAEIKVINPNNSLDNSEYYGDNYGFQAHAGIKYRGNSSYYTFDKKQYRIEFRQGDGKESNKRYSVMGMAPASDWVLNNPFLDRSLLRNRILYSVSRELNVWSPETRYCELFLNGEYQGLYLMVEAITNEEGRLNLTNFGLLSGQTAYLLQRERYGTEDSIINSFGEQRGYTSHQLSIRYPTKNNLTKVQHRWIENDINEFERVLYSNGFEHPEFGYKAHIDLNSFVDFYIINELAMNVDASYLSTYIYKDLGGKLKFAVWDFNNAFDHTQWQQSYLNKFYIAEGNWFNRLFQDPSFTDAVVSRYRELRKDILSEENLLRLVDRNIELLGDAIDRNFEIWGYTFYYNLMASDDQGNSRDPASYQEAVEQLKQTIIARGNFLDNNIDNLYNLSLD